MDTIPPLLAKVRLRRGSEEYLVVDVDLDRNLVELLSITGTNRLVPNVPVTAVDELVEEPPDYL